MNTLILHGTNTSPPCRAVLLAAKSLGLDIKMKQCDVFGKKENMNESFLKMNPAHSVPLMEDKGVVIWESRAIMAYLVQKYGKNDQLYPKDLNERILVDNILHFDGASFFGSIGQFPCQLNDSKGRVKFPGAFVQKNDSAQRFGPVLGGGWFTHTAKDGPQIFFKAPPDPAREAGMKDKLTILNNILEGNEYVAGKQMTIADLSIMAGVSVFDSCDYDIGSYPNVVRWAKKIKELPFYDEVMKEGVEGLGGFYRLSQNK